MRLVAERLAETARLAQLGSYTPADRVAVRELLQEERESLAKSQALVENDALSAQYRRNMGIAAGNSRKVIGLLREALRAMKAGDPHAATAALEQVLGVRSKRSRTARQPQQPQHVELELVAQWAAYQREHNPGFRQWLAAAGTAAAEAQGSSGETAPRPVVKPQHRPRTRSARANRPEDYL